ncbi:hypothetical protein LCGC14_2220520, partial [marine sediment metagenome]
PTLALSVGFNRSVLMLVVALLPTVKHMRNLSNPGNRLDTDNQRGEITWQIGI